MAAVNSAANAASYAASVWRRSDRDALFRNEEEEEEEEGGGGKFVKGVMLPDYNPHNNKIVYWSVCLSSIFFAMTLRSKLKT